MNKRLDWLYEEDGKTPYRQRLRDLEKEGSRIKKQLDDGEFINRGRLERQLSRLDRQIEQQKYRVEVRRKG